MIWDWLRCGRSDGALVRFIPPVEAEVLPRLPRFIPSMDED